MIEDPGVCDCVRSEVTFLVLGGAHKAVGVLMAMEGRPGEARRN